MKKEGQAGDLPCTEDVDADDCCLIPLQGLQGLINGPAPIAGKLIGKGKTGTPGGCAEVCAPICSEGDDNAAGTRPPEPTCVKGPFSVVDLCDLLEAVDEGVAPEGLIFAYLAVSKICPEDLLDKVCVECGFTFLPICATD